MSKIICVGFVTVMLSFGLTSEVSGQVNNEKPSETQQKAYIDIGGQNSPDQGKRLSEEEVEKVREEMKRLQTSINVSKAAKNAQNSIRSIKAATEARNALNSLKETKAQTQTQIETQAQTA